MKSFLRMASFGLALLLLAALAGCNAPNGGSGAGSVVGASSDSMPNSTSAAPKDAYLTQWLAAAEDWQAALASSGYTPTRNVGGPMSSLLEGAGGGIYYLVEADTVETVLDYAAKLERIAPAGDSTSDFAAGVPAGYYLELQLGKSRLSVRDEEITLGPPVDEAVYTLPEKELEAFKDFFAEVGQKVEAGNAAELAEVPAARDALIEECRAWRDELAAGTATVGQETPSNAVLASLADVDTMLGLMEQMTPHLYDYGVAYSPSDGFIIQLGTVKISLFYSGPNGLLFHLPNTASPNISVYYLLPDDVARANRPWFDGLRPPPDLQPAG